MTFNDILTLEESKVKKLLLLDIDDTIVKAKNIYIYKKVVGQEIKLTPEQFAKEKVTSENAYQYDFREFEDAEKISGSIKSGEPIIPTLRYMDRMISKGYVVGILTARGLEKVIQSILQSWLMYNKKGKLRNIGNKLKEVFAINDQIKKYKGVSSSEKKANVIKNLASKYDKIIFIDDDMKNINEIRGLTILNVQAKHISEIDNI